MTTASRAPRRDGVSRTFGSSSGYFASSAWPRSAQLHRCRRRPALETAAVRVAITITSGQRSGRPDQPELRLAPHQALPALRRGDRWRARACRGGERRPPDQLRGVCRRSFGVRRPSEMESCYPHRPSSLVCTSNRGGHEAPEDIAVVDPLFPQRRRGSPNWSSTSARGTRSGHRAGRARRRVERPSGPAVDRKRSSRSTRWISASPATAMMTIAPWRHEGAQTNQLAAPSWCGRAGGLRSARGASCVPSVPNVSAG